MKFKKLTQAIIVALSTSTTMSVMAENVSLSDYNEATSAYEDAYINGQFNLNSGNQEQTSYDLDLYLDYERVFSSADTNIKIDFSGDSSRSRSANKNEDDVSNYQAISSVNYDNYFDSAVNDLFWYGKGEIGVRKGAEDPFTKITGGIGYGRVVNVTPMAKAIRLVESLIERNLLKDSPSIAIYQAIASIIAKESEYRSKYGFADYEQSWIADIEKALGKNLGVRGAIKSYQVLINERISTRKDGWLVRAGVGAVITDYDGNNGKPALEIGLEFHKPLSNKTQFSNELILTAALDDDSNSFVGNNVMGLTYEVSDRVDWENSWLLTYNYNENFENTVSNALTSTYRYYISNALSLNLTAKLSKLEDHVNDNGNDDVDKSLLVGLTYRLK
jgi:hypothetical protein